MERPSGGFTLLEVLGVVLLTTLVLGIALDYYVDLSRASSRATDHMRDVRRASAILDRVARDLEGAVLEVKPEETDPLEWPWVFYGESRRGGEGADQLRFVTRSHQPRHSEGHESDLAVVAFGVRQAEDETLELMRWSSPRLPDSLERDVPRDESQGALLLADRLAEFGVTFIDASGERSSHWDSSEIVHSGDLPAAAEISVAFAPADPGGGPVRDEPGAELQRYRRVVLLPVRPLDMRELADPTSAVNGGTGEQTEGEEEGEGKEGDEDELADSSDGDPDCFASPCGQLTVCQAADCQALAQYNSRLFQTIGDGPFCRWEQLIRRANIRITNPACL